MGRIQRFILSLSGSRSDEVEADSRAWHLQCPDCGSSKSLWELGGVRYKATSTGKRIRGHCSTCGTRRWLRYVRVDPTTPLVSDAGAQLDLVTIIVDDYDEAIAFYVEILGFELVEDEPSLTHDGRPKRWVVVRPPGAATGILLALADSDRQRAAVGDQWAGRVGLFLRVADFESAHRRLVDHDVELVGEPRDEAYGRVAVFVDIAGNRWDLLGPRLG